MARASERLVGPMAVLMIACGGDERGADSTNDAAPADTRETAGGDTAQDTSPEVDPNAIACCPVGTCADSSKACVGGACLPKKTSAEACYFDGECRDGKRCLGATSCACGSTDCTPIAGTCAYPSGCCNGDGDCAGGELCVQGTCRARPGDGCWRDSHCDAGEVCEGAAPAACGEGGSDVAGYCALPGVCCGSDAECGDGVCRGGRCVERAGAGRCWSDAECGGAETCLGERLCECAAGASDTNACAVLPTQGRCGEADESCCAGDGDCAAGEICVEGECAARPDREKDECWVDGHCGLGRMCEGASLCGCNEDGCSESVIGQCKTRMIPCAGDAECPTAMRCILPDQAYCPYGEDGEPIAQPGVCVERVDVGCWEKSDCAPELRCGAEVVCRDPAGCDPPNRAGECRDKVKRWDCCDAHDECQDGYECRNQDSSLTCPPSSSAVCLNEAVFGERCWNVEDCPAGLSCYRVWICGCNGKCYFNRQGECEVPSNCQTNLDCGEGYVCAVDPECFASPCTTASTCTSGGQCQLVVDGGCWTHDECGAGRYCEGLRICPADTTCTVPDQPGICADRAGLGECCTSFKGCEPGLRCLSPAQRSGCKIDHTSVCVPAQTPGASCYGDEDCDAQQRCDGARICPCGVETCTDPPSAGTCVAR